jgi:hypothetical protein
MSTICRLGKRRRKACFRSNSIGSFLQEDFVMAEVRDFLVGSHYGCLGSHFQLSTNKQIQFEMLVAFESLTWCKSWILRHSIRST